MDRKLIIRTTVLLLGVYALLACEGCPQKPCRNEDGTGTTVQMTPFSGRFGYGLSGPYSFIGSLTKETLMDISWHFEGQFVFPTGGYTVDSPVIVVAESYPEQVSITIKVTPPPPDSVVTQAVTHVPVVAQITASNEAKFSIQITGADDIPPSDLFEVFLDNEKDGWQLLAGQGEPVLLITCPSGIGSAVIHCKNLCPVQHFAVGLRYAEGKPFLRLEGFEITSPKGTKWTDPSTCSCAGYLNATVPAAVFDEDNDELTINWVDMYR